MATRFGRLSHTSDWEEIKTSTTPTSEVVSDGATTNLESGISGMVSDIVSDARQAWEIIKTKDPKNIWEWIEWEAWQVIELSVTGYEICDIVVTDGHYIILSIESSAIPISESLTHLAVDKSGSTLVLVLDTGVPRDDIWMDLDEIPGLISQEWWSVKLQLKYVPNALWSARLLSLSKIS